MSESSAELAAAGRAAAPDRDLEQAITSLKKGAYLLKYGRRGKPKFCPFRLSNDESSLIWLSRKEEKQLKLCHVSRIIPGQRTEIFQRNPRPDKECQSFSLIYGDRSLDVICKDKDEAEIWFAGLKLLVSRSNSRKWRTESQSATLSSGPTSPRAYTQRGSPLSSPFSCNDSVKKDNIEPYQFQSPYSSPPKAKSCPDKKVNEAMNHAVPTKGFSSESATGSVHSLPSTRSANATGHPKGFIADAFRVSLSSVVSSSSQGSGNDDGDAFGGVFIWGQGTEDGILGGALSSDVKMDSFLPKALECAVKLDVQNISCGGRHAALVTKQGEVYSWGEEAGGRLGHGIDCDVSQPKLIDALSHANIERVECGEYHTCAVTLSGELYSWGGGTFNFGLLGHGKESCNWIPKRIGGPLDGIPVASVSCGPWHTAVVTSSGQLFTFGDGSFGVLGHGDRISVSIPKEVDSLRGLRTVRVSCGVWHTAAVVEVMVEGSGFRNSSSGKIFTWGDGDKGRLGHGDREPRLIPTCVSALVEQNFCQIACGHCLTVALTTTGHVYTMGSSVFGQLGNPKCDGIVPVKVEGKLHRNFVEEVSCGAYHVAVLTSRTEVYTWGKGANGRLGHGDSDDKNMPTLVEALKDKQVRTVVCGINFTAAICIHRWASGVDQSTCSGCHLPFNFKRKRHNCYNCALAVCNFCSTKKSPKATLGTNCSKPYRVCDSCYNKLRKVSEPDMQCAALGYNEVINEENVEVSSGGPLSRLSSMESFKKIDSKFRRSKKFEFNSSRVSPVANGSSQWGGLNISRSFTPMFGTSRKFFAASVPGSRYVSRATSPVSRRASPPRSVMPRPTIGSQTSCRVDEPKFIGESGSKEVMNLKAQVDSLTRKNRLLEVELDRITKQLKETLVIAGEESARCKAAKEVIKSLTGQKGVAEKLPGVADVNTKVFLSSSSSVTSEVSSATAEAMNGLLNTESHQSCPNGSVHPSKPCSVNLDSTKDIFEDAINGDTILNADWSGESKWVEQDESGVYITLSVLPGGGRELKRVRFSRKRFSEKQAEQWWAENRARVYTQYNLCIAEKSSSNTGIPSQ